MGAVKGVAQPLERGWSAVNVTGHLLPGSRLESSGEWGPTHPYAAAPTGAPQNANLFGNRVIADVLG